MSSNIIKWIITVIILSGRNASSNWNTESQRHITESQRILREAGIDINRVRNFTWAQNGAGNHSVAKVILGKYLRSILNI